MISAERIARVWPPTYVRKAWEAKSLPALATALSILAIAVVVAVPPLTYSVAILAGIATGLVAMINPLFALGALVLSVPFSSLVQIAPADLEVTTTELIVALLLFSWGGKILRGRGTKVSFGSLAVPLALFIGLVFLSATTSTSLPLSLKELLKWLEMLAVYLFVVNCVTNRRQITVLLIVLGLAAAAEALIGYYQFFLRAGPEGFRLGGFLRAYGTFGQPNPFAGYLASVAVPALALGLVPQIKRLRSGRASMPRSFILFFLGIATIVSLAIVMSMSRGAWLGLAVGVAIVAGVASRRALIVLVAIVFVVALTLLAGSLSVLPAQFSDRIGQIVEYFRLFDARAVKLTPQNWAVVERMANWQSAWGMFERNPFFGVGIGNYAAAYADFALPLWRTPKGHAHNVYLNFLAEMGIAGLAAYFLLLAAIFAHAAGTVRSAFRSFAPFRAATPDAILLASVALGMLGALVAISIHNVFDSLFVHGMTAQIGLMLGLITVVNRLTKEAVLANEESGGS